MTIDIKKLNEIIESIRADAVNSGFVVLDDPTRLKSKTSERRFTRIAIDHRFDIQIAIEKKLNGDGRVQHMVFIETTRPIMMIPGVVGDFAHMMTQAKLLAEKIEPCCGISRQ